MSLMAAIRKKGQTGTGLKPVDRSKSKTEDKTSSDDSEAHQPNLLASTGKGTVEKWKGEGEHGSGKQGPGEKRRHAEAKGSRRLNQKQFVTTLTLWPNGRKPEQEGHYNDQLRYQTAPAVPPPAGAPR